MFWINCHISHKTDILIFIYIHDNVPKNLYIISQHSKSLVVEGKGGLAQFQAMAMNLSMTLHNCSTRAAIITPARNIAIFKRDFRRNFRHSFKTSRINPRSKLPPEKTSTEKNARVKLASKIVFFVTPGRFAIRLCKISVHANFSVRVSPTGKLTGRNV